MAWLAGLLLIAGPHGNPAVPVRDIKPGFVRGGRVLRSRTGNKPGIFVAGERHRGLNSPVPSRIGLNVDRAFALLRVKVAVVDGSSAPVRFRVVGDGLTLAATPPLFAGAKPVVLEVDTRGVLLLELVAEGERGARAAWIRGMLVPGEGKTPGKFRALNEPFSPRDYPAAFRRRVNNAIDKGVKYLLAQQRPNGSWRYGNHQPMGLAALATLALLKAGVPAKSPAIDRAFGYMRSLPYERTYSVACLLMALEARYFPGGHDEKSAYLDRPRRAKQLIPAGEQVWIRDAAMWLVAQQSMGFSKEHRALHPVWRYPQGGYDLSNTQYALLGLSAANRCGVATSKVWLPALRYILGVQEKEGPAMQVSRYFRRGKFLRRRYERAWARGFGYQARSAPTGSMTSAGLCSLILCQQALYRSAKYTGLRDKTRAAIRDALAWLEEYYEIDRNPFSDHWWHYYLFNLERAGVLLDQRYVGTRDWYREGSEILVKTQGSAGNVQDGPVGTAFALLFWKRATVPAITSPLK